MKLTKEQLQDIKDQQLQSNKTKRVTVSELEKILYEAIPILDHGFIRVIDYMGDDTSIVQSARVSYGKGTKKVSTDSGLIKYLMRHWHSTPFEMCEIKYHVKLPIFIARQWIRHRTANVNEYSARYSILDKEFYLPSKENLAAQSQSNRQGRGDTLKGEQAEEVLNLLKNDAERTYQNYETMLNERYDGNIIDDNKTGLARELARMNLTLNTYTQWYWKIDLHNLLHFLSLRADPHAQWEIRVFANIIAGMVKRVAPLSFEAWIDYDLLGQSMSRAELSVLAELLDADGSGVATRSGVSFSSEKLKEIGLSGREIEEFLTKLHCPSAEDFELDLSTMRKAEEVQSEMHEAVPGHFE